MFYNDGRVRTLQQPRGAFRDVFKQHVAAAIEQETVERRFVFVLGDGLAQLTDATAGAGAGLEDFDGVS